jgi:replicative DNA helicase
MTGEIERALVATVFVRPEIVLEVPALTASAFTVVEYRTIFEAASRACVASQKPERLDIANSAIRALGIKEDPVKFFERTTAGLSLHADPRDFHAKADVLMREQRRRALQAEGKRWGDALTQGADPDASLSDHLSRCSAAQGQRGWTTLGAEMETFQRERADVQTNGVRQLDAALATGYPSLEHIRFAPGKVIVLAGRPGNGKTTLSLCIGVNVADRGMGVCYHAVEPSADELRAKLVARASKVRGPELLTAGDQVRSKVIDDASEYLKSLPFAMTEGVFKFVDLCALTKRISETPPWPNAPLRLVIIDYVQLLEHKTKRESQRHEQLGEIVRGITRMAHALRVTVLLLSSIGRAIETDNRKDRSKRLPGMADLGESGALERDASAVLILHRDNLDPREIKVVNPKNRNGPMLNKVLRSDFEFDDITEAPSQTEMRTWNS